MSLGDEMSEASMAHHAAIPAQQLQPAPPPWYAGVLGPIIVTCVLTVTGAALVLWRSQPTQEITLAHLEKRQRDLETQITRHDTRIGEIERSGLATASDVRSNREQIEALRVMVGEIRAYNASTMKEIQTLAQGFSRIEGYYLNQGAPPRRSDRD